MTEGFSVQLDDAEFNRIIRAIDNLKMVIPGVAETTLRSFSLVTAATLKKNILSQVYGDFGTSHSESWIKRKGNDTYWRYTDSLLNSIIGNKIIPISGSNISYFAGVPNGAMNGNKEITDYAFSLEYGEVGNKIPGRPLFHYTMRDLMPYYMEKFALAQSMIFEVWS